MLAGGRSSRFGADKALALYEGERLLARAVAVLREFGLEPAIVSAPGRAYAFAGCPVVADVLPEKGPLGGIYTAMTAFRDEAFLILTCDMPLVDEHALLILCRDASKAPMAVFSCENRIHPFPGIYRRSAFDAIVSRLDAERLSMRGLLDELAEVRPWHGSSRAFANVNRAEDLSLIRNTDVI